MKIKSLDTVLMTAVFLFLLPCICCMLLPDQQLGEKQDFPIIKEGYDMELACDGGIRNLPLEEYLLGTLAAYADMNSEPQMLKAMTVVLRSIAVSCTEEGKECDLVYYDYWTRKSLWGSKCAEYTNLGRKLIAETVHEVLTTPEGMVVNVPFFEVSAGATRNGSEIGSAYDYLTSVECMSDIESDDYMKIVRINQKKIGSEISVLAADTQGYVLRIEIDGVVYDGEDFRLAAGLPSACFTIEESKGDYVFAVKGKGHGYGMSRYGAQKKALDGSNYKDILQYYFPKLTVNVYQFYDKP